MEKTKQKKIIIIVAASIAGLALIIGGIYIIRKRRGK